jgi:hypothetical protein
VTALSRQSAARTHYSTLLLQPHGGFHSFVCMFLGLYWIARVGARDGYLHVMVRAIWL